MPILNQGAIDRIAKVVNTVETRFDDFTDPETPILHGGANGILGKLDGNLNYNSTATVSIWTGAVNSEADSGNNIEGVGCRWLSSGKKINSGSWVWCEQTEGGQWYVIAGPCEVAQ